MHDYYDILDVSRTAGADEIRRSFRRKAKECHPDHNGHRTEWAQARTRLVIEAYHVLRDVERRLEYDMMLAQDPETARKKFWAKWEHARRNDESVAGKMRLMLHYLLTERGGEAVEIYRELRANNGKTDLKGHLSDRDHFDCLFLLAEELERMGDVVGAAEQYAEMYRTLRTKPVRAYLHMEVRNRLYCLLTRGLPRKMGKKNSARYYIDALKMRLSKAEQAFVHKKLAECHLARGERELAAEHLRTAFGLKPGLKGTKKIVEQLQARGSNAKEKFRFETSGGV